MFSHDITTKELRYCTSTGIPLENMLKANESLQAEMMRFAKLREESPERCQAVYTLGEEMVELARQGKYSKFQRKLLTMEKDMVYLFFTRRMFLASVMGSHFALSDLMIEQGFSVVQPGLPTPLHEVCNSASDSIAAGAAEFLVQRCKLDVNSTAQGTWETPLHLAVRRQLPLTVAKLVALGADVDAVALQDAMPLTMARKAAEDAGEVLSGVETSQDMETREAAVATAAGILDVLERHGARDTWRRHSVTPQSTTAGPTVFSSNVMSTGGSGGGGFAGTPQYSDSGTRAGDARGSMLAADLAQLKNSSDGATVFKGFAGGGGAPVMKGFSGGGSAPVMKGFSGGGGAIPSSLSTKKADSGATADSDAVGGTSIGTSDDSAQLFSTG